MSITAVEYFITFFGFLVEMIYKKLIIHKKY